ncbi:hypothetical protein BASA81_005166 [Batrachochytrium salamandrivorans]|nr:hypothetical protein BASA81_005166 [Batrachochytrium salamandrivorans]
MSVLTSTKDGFQASIDPATKQIDTVKFVAACQDVAKIYDALFMGLIASQLKGDITNSSSCLQKAFLANPVDRATLQALVDNELKLFGKDKVRVNKASGIVSLLWAKRAVTFILTYLDFLGTKPDWSAGQCAQQTYEVVLKRYHGWLTAKMVGAAMGLAPSREDIFVKLGLPKGGESAAIAEFVAVLKLVMGEVHRLLSENDCDFPDTV